MSDEKTVMSFDAAMKVGDRAFAEVVVDHDGTLAFPTSSGGVARTQWNPEYTGIRLRDITRAPVPREVVNVPCEVLRDDDLIAFDDVAFIDGCVRLISDPLFIGKPAGGLRLFGHPARVLRPIKKP